VGVGGVVFGEVFAVGAAFVDSLFEVFEFVVGVVVFRVFLEAWEQVAADGVEFGGAGEGGGGGRGPGTRAWSCCTLLLMI